MAGRKRNASADSSPRATRSSTRAAPQNAARRTAAGPEAAVPAIYRQMVAEARAELRAQNAAGTPERPLKRRRPGERTPAKTTAPAASTPSKSTTRETGGDAANTTSGNDVQFENAMLPTPTVQTITRSDDEDEDDDIDFEDVAIEKPAAPSAATPEKKSQELSLDLSAHMGAAASHRPDRRKAINREEKARRLEIHKVHLVCLLAHVELRNRWCNDRQVQDSLRPLLPQKTVAALLPRASLNQFGRSESFRRGVQEAKDLFRLKFTITERGLWRALWAEDEEQLKNVRRDRLHLPGARLIIHPSDSINFQTTSTLSWTRTILSKRPGRYRVPAMSVRSCSVLCSALSALKPGSYVPFSLCLLPPEPLRCHVNGSLRSLRSNRPRLSFMLRRSQSTRQSSPNFKQARQRPLFANGWATHTPPVIGPPPSPGPPTRLPRPEPRVPELFAASPRFPSTG